MIGVTTSLSTRVSNYSHGAALMVMIRLFYNFSPVFDLTEAVSVFTVLISGVLWVVSVAKNERCVTSAFIVWDKAVPHIIH